MYNSNLRLIRTLSTKKTGLSSSLSPSTKLNSHLFITQQKPELSKLPTHELLQKLGYIRQFNPGLVHWLPLGLKVLRNLENIIHFRMTEIDALEVSISSLSESQLWQRTGRWDNTELFKLQDSKGKDYCLVPTCEEEITRIMQNDLISYKNLPVLVYQISRKYRDEKRPRAGLLRGREFIMKDGYSFHIDKSSALQMFHKVNEAYRRIFQDIKVPVVSLNADSGDIGGDLSWEWHYLHENGEDTLLTCDNCGAISNLEKCQSLGPEVDDVEVSYYTNTDFSTLICLYYPAGRKLIPGFVREHIPDINLNITSQEEILSHFQDEDSFLTKTIVRVMDARLHDRLNFPDLEVPYHRGSFSTLTGIPLVEAQEGEICYECELGTLLSDKAIEVGHTFYLGDRYSKPMSLQLPNSLNQSTDLLMGCYGIGVSRLVAAIVEMTRDSQGLCWPASILPYQVTFIVLPSGEETDKNIGILDIISNALIADGVRVQRDLRDVSIGRKLNESKSLGIPLQVIIGKNYPIVEIEIRGKKYSNTFIDSYKELSEKYQWTYTDTPLEKHRLHIDGLFNIIQILLNDL